MNRLTPVIAALVCGMIATFAEAVPPGKTAEWDAPMGKVTFDGKVHADKGLKCLDCHSKIFKMKKGSTEMKMADIHAGKFCGVCHNGIKAYATNNPDNCPKCHKKPEK
jgi:c(7)-type cytochrome triheme protein